MLHNLTNKTLTNSNRASSSFFFLFEKKKKKKEMGSTLSTDSGAESLRQLVQKLTTEDVTDRDILFMKVIAMPCSALQIYQIATPSDIRKIKQT
jgi:hypothetical protein